MMRPFHCVMTERGTGVRLQQHDGTVVEGVLYGQSPKTLRLRSATVDENQPCAEVVVDRSSVKGVQTADPCAGGIPLLAFPAEISYLNLQSN